MAHKVLDNLKYTKDHEWVLIENDNATIGITDFAQSSLGDIVFIELPSIDTELKAGRPCGVVESIKSANDIYCPVDGKVSEINTDLESSPENCNKDPYAAWLIKVKLDANQSFDELMDASAYTAFCENN